MIQETVHWVVEIRGNEKSEWRWRPVSPDEKTESEAVQTFNDHKYYVGGGKCRIVKVITQRRVEFEKELVDPVPEAGDKVGEGEKPVCAHPVLLWNANTQVCKTCFKVVKAMNGMGEMEEVLDDAHRRPME